MSPRSMPLTPALRAAVALAAVAVTGCAAAERAVAPSAPADAPRIHAASPALLAAVGDAELRLLPTLAPALQPALGGALAELQAALESGEVPRTRRALAATRSLVADAAALAADETLASGGGAADLGAIAMLVAAAEHELTPTAVAAAPVE